MKSLHCRAERFLAAGLMLGFLCAWAHAGRSNLPPKARESIQRNFPKARITAVGRERENGVMYYEVNLKENGKRFEVEVTADGTIGEIEANLRLSDLPADVREIVAKATKGASRIRIEKHERRGRAKNGTFVPLAQPTERYEVKYYLKGKRRRLWLDAQDIATLPETARAAVQKAFPKATITSVEIEYEDGAQICEVDLTDEGREISLKMSAKGTITELKAKIAVGDIPATVMTTVRGQAKGARVQEAGKVELRAVVKGGRLSRLREPALFYEVEVVKGGREADIKVAPDGKLLEAVEWEDDEDDDDEDDDDD